VRYDQKHAEDVWVHALSCHLTAFQQELDVVVAAIVPGFAAADSNQFDVGDIVLSIDNVLVSSIPLSEVKQLTIGKVGTQISLIMRSPTEVNTICLLRPRPISEYASHAPVWM